MKHTGPNRQTRGFLFQAIAVILPCVTLIVAYSVYLTVRSLGLYDRFLASPVYWTGKLHAADPRLGYAPVPNAHGSLVYSTGREVAVCYDHSSLRVPCDGPADASDSARTVIALGCSFTFGAGVRAEESFSSVFARKTGMKEFNLGRCSYGPAQMLILAREWIPRVRPDIVLIQFSPWLVDRACSQVAPSYLGTLPVPYFTGEKVFAIAKPVFSPVMYRLPFDTFRAAPSPGTDRIRFILSAGLPLLAYEDLQLALRRGRNVFGFNPRPTRNRDEMVRSVYHEIDSPANSYGGISAVVVLGSDHQPVHIDRNLFSKRSVIVNAHHDLLSKLSERSMEEFRKHYNIWDGEPPVLIDDHPNSHAHYLISECIIASMGD